MKNRIINKISLILLVAYLAAVSCQAPEGNSPGSEYMPDMAHSIAYEANYYNYYYNNTWGTEDEYYNYAHPRRPVEGTVPTAPSARYDRVVANKDNIMADPLTTPYYFEDSEEGRTKAINELIYNPYPITENGLDRGKELYNVFCGICHGEKGNGLGYLVREPDPAKGDEGGKYPNAPANFLLPEHLEASNGRYYHAIMYGKNVMGAYKGKLSFEERWQVIHYIRLLQAKELKKEYNQLVNTLNDIDQPAGDLSYLDIESMYVADIDANQKSDNTDHSDHDLDDHEHMESLPDHEGDHDHSHESDKDMGYQNTDDVHNGNSSDMISLEMDKSSGSASKSDGEIETSGDNDLK